MTQTQEKHCGRDVEYDFGNKTGACGSATRSGSLKCEDCRATETAAARPAVEAAVIVVCEIALADMRKEWASLLELQEQQLKSLEKTNADAAERRRCVEELEAFLAAQQPST